VDSHLTKPDRIGLDELDTEAIYRFANLQRQGDTLHPSLVLEDREDLLRFCPHVRVDIVYLYSSVLRFIFFSSTTHGACLPSVSNPTVEAA